MLKDWFVVSAKSMNSFYDVATTMLIFFFLLRLLKKHEKIVLYAGVDNPARKVYARVGFQGLTAESSAVDGADHWLEIGFDQAKVDLGHW